MSIITYLIEGTYKDKGFNFAKSDALSSDLVQQARELVSALETDPRINMNLNWKVHMLYKYYN